MLQIDLLDGINKIIQGTKEANYNIYQIFEIQQKTILRVQKVFGCHQTAVSFLGR